MKKYFILFLILMLIPLVLGSDVQSLGLVKQNNNITLKQNCINITYANITSITVTGSQTIDLINTPISMNLISNGYQTYNFLNTSNPGYYIVTGICDQNGAVISWSYDFTVTPTGKIFQLSDITVYLFFFFICLIIGYFSVSLLINHPISKDLVKGKELYEIKKRNNFEYYLNLLKQKSWILGAFGLYLSILVFIVLSEQLVYNLGLSDLESFIQYFVIIGLWGLIPFTIFWLAYIIIVFYLTTIDALKWQLGNIGGRR